MKIVEVSEVPREGEFIIISWDGDGMGALRCKSNGQGAIRIYDDEKAEWGGFTLRSEFLKSGLDVCKFFIAQPSYKEITFDYDWQLLKWLREHEGERLYSKDVNNGVTVKFSDGEYWRVYKSMSRSLFTDLATINKKTWYIKEGEQCQK